MNHPKEVRALYCDCCGTEKMAVLHEDKLVITDRRHGQRHVIVIPIDSLVKQAQHVVR